MSNAVAGGLLALAGAAIIGAGVVGNVAWQNTETTQTCTVESKTAVGTKNGTDYRVYTEQCGTLQVVDDLFAGRFNSADEYARLKEGETYRLTTIGWRNGLFSLFPNIVEVSK